MKQLFIAAVASLFCSVLAHAVVAKPGLITTRQPDGTPLTIKMEGGPRGHNVYTADDQLLMTDERGFYVPADEAFVGRMEQKAAKRSVAPRNLPGLMTNRFPTVGEQKAMVVLVEFSDTRFTIDSPIDFYDDLLNGTDFRQYGATGSARQYFMENSGDAFDISFDIYGPVALANPAAYYGANDYWGDDMRAHQMIIDACDILHSQGAVDFRDYDKNSDGVIDIVYVFYAGYGEADGGGPNTIWPHSWDLTEAGVKQFYDGLQLNHYACSNELQYSFDGQPFPDGIGTFCHEFSHVMGIPDLYSTLGGGAFTPDSWTIMDSGSYNNNSRTPPYFSAFERAAFGWLTPEEITSSGTYSLAPIGAENKAYIIPTSSENEYFLLENRQLREWDAHLPHHGMVVWHIDYNSRVWDNNTVNVDAKHQRVDLVEADGIPSNWTRDGDAFPGLYEKEEFSASSTPALRAWDGKSLGVDLYDIKETPEGNISFYAAIEGDTSAIEGMTASESNVEVRYYNLQGIEIAWPAKGETVIEKRGATVRKIIIR